MRKITIALKTSGVGRLFNMLFVVASVVASAFMFACSEGGDNDVDKTYVEGVSMTSNKAEVCNGAEQMLTITFETNTPGGTDDLLFYGLTTVEYLIGSVTIQQLN